MRHSRSIKILVALVGSLALAGCGTTVRVNGAEVDSKVPFLAVVEQAWRTGRAGEANSSLAKETGCWLLRAPDTGTIEPKALCGPIRHLKDKGQPGVFDEVQFEPIITGGKEVAVNPDSIVLGGTGVEVPLGYELYRPDGTQPVPANEVPEPPAPKADPGIVLSANDVELANGRKPELGAIRVPRWSISATEVGTVPSLPPASDKSNFVPTDGEEFIAVTLSLEKQEYDDSGDAETETKAAIKVDGKVTPIDLNYETIIVSVPLGGDAQLAIAVGGLEQTMSVRTGARTSKTASAYYRSKTSFSVNEEFNQQTYKNGSFEYKHGVHFKDASIFPFHPDRGWAPKGQMWLSMSWDTNISDDESHGCCYGSVKFDEDRIMEIMSDSGKPGEIVGGIPITETIYGQTTSDSVLLALVPEAAKSLGVTYAPQGTFSATSYGLQNDYLQPKQGSFKFEALKFGITL